LNEKPTLDMVDFESNQSFPASDPPSFSSFHAGIPSRHWSGTMANPVYPPSTSEIAHQRRELAPDVHKAWDEFSRKVFADGALSGKLNHLIAVAAAHVTQCPYCIKGHTRAALRHGATREEIMESIWVAAEMRAGGAFAHSTISLAAMNEFTEEEMQKNKS
jgi:AhpD family alkylhydroperoxidase